MAAHTRFTQQNDSKKLESWMKLTVALKLKEVDGKEDASGPRLDTLSTQEFVTRLLYRTFTSIEICRRYLKMI